MAIKNAETVLAKINRGAELRRGCVGGWYLYRGAVRIGRVTSAAAHAVIDSGSVERSDDRTTVAGETYIIAAAKATSRQATLPAVGTAAEGQGEIQ